MPMPRKLLLILARCPNQTLSKDEITARLWPDGIASASLQRRSASIQLVVHRLREVFARGPLGRDVIRVVYGKGYRLDAVVEPWLAESPISALSRLVPLDPSLQKPAAQEDSVFLSNLFYAEAHDLWPDRDPSSLPRKQWLMQQCIHNDPSFSQGYLELCYLLLLQCLWGVRSATSTLPVLERWLRLGDQLPAKAPGWAAIKAEVMSLLLWQPQTSHRLYGNWLAPTLPSGPARFSWARHLIVSGRPRLALQLLESQALPTLSQGWLVRSLAYAALGDLMAAQQAAEVQLRLNPSMVGTQLILAMLLALRGDTRKATGLVEACGLLTQPFQGSLALAAYALAQGRLRPQAHQFLDEALALIPTQPDRVGALGYWGLAALALDRSSDAIGLLTLSVKRRCYTAPLLLATPFLTPFAHMPACQLFREKMGEAFVVAS